MHVCAKHGKRICIACFLQTAIFPVEHFFWTRILGFHF